MADVPANSVGQLVGEPNNNRHHNAFDLGAFVGDLTVDEEVSSNDDISLEGLQQELEDCKYDDVVANILSEGTKLREYTKGVENNLRQVELDSIQDYIEESDNLVSLHGQIRDCDTILSQMEALLSGFQAEIGSISSDIKVLQEKSMDMGLKLKNRKVAESKLAKFVEDIIIPPRMIDIIVDGEVNEEYMRTLEILSKKLKFVEVDPTVQTSKALKDVQPELEKLRQKAVSKVFDYVIQKLYALRKPKTNIQILQQNVLLKYKYVISFLKEHGKEVYKEVRAAYIDTMNKVLSAHFRSYIQALEKLQLDIATSSDLIGIETRSSGLFSLGREPLKNKSAVYALGERISILKEIDQPALIPHIAEASSIKYPYEVLFRSLHKLLMDTATSEYLFCDEFFGEESLFTEIFSGPFTVIDEHFNTILPNCYDAIGLMLMIRIIHQHQLIMSRRRIPCLDSYLDKVNIALWPRFKMVFDMHLNSLRNANVKTLWEDDVHPHYVMRRYAEFTASLIQLNVEYGDGQLELHLERLRMAVDDVLIKLAKMFPKAKQQTVFLINNYDMTIAVLKEAGPEAGKVHMRFEELLKSNTALYVEELLLEHFNDLIKFVKTRASEESSSSSERPITVAEVEPLVKDFASRWKTAIELMHKDVITSFSNFLCGMEILRAALTQLLLYYTRLSDCIKRVDGGASLNKDLVSISSIIFDRYALDLLERMLTLDPSKRIAAKEALDHDYFWTDPLPCDPRSLPKYEASHEFQTKKKRQQQRQNEEAAKRQKMQHPQQHSRLPPIQHAGQGPPHWPGSNHPMNSQPPIPAGPGHHHYGKPRGPPGGPNRYPPGGNPSGGYNPNRGGQVGGYSSGPYPPPQGRAPYGGSGMPGGPRGPGSGYGGGPSNYSQGGQYGGSAANRGPNSMGGSWNQQYGWQQ